MPRRHLAWLNGPAFLASVVYLVVLHWSITTFLKPSQTFFALKLSVDPSLGSVVVAIVLSSAAAVLLPRRLGNPADFTLAVIFFVVCLPAAVIQASMDSVPAVLGPLSAATTVAVALAARAFSRGATLPASPKRMMFRGSRWSAFLIAIIATSFTVYMVFLFPGHLRLVGLADVYELRSATSGEKYRFYAYASSIYVGAVGPVALAYGILRRNWFIAAAGLAGFVWIYMASGNRSAFIAVGLSVALLLLRRSSLKTTILPVLLAFGTVSAVAIDHVRGSLAATPLLVDRLLLAPGVLSTLYVSYFSEHQHVVWHHSFLRSLPPGRVEDPAITIGRAYFGEGNFANANFMAEGYANLGVAGSLLLLLLLIGELALLRWVTRGYAGLVSLAVTVPFTIAVTNISPVTVVLTGGLAFLVPMLLIAFGPPPPRRPRTNTPRGSPQYVEDGTPPETVPLISVVIPHYNSKGLVLDAITSALEQSVRDMEVIVVDDCSSDGSWEVVRSRFGSDPRVRLVSMAQNSGSPAQPRNVGIDLAQGGYIAFLDADDRWLPEKVERQLTCMAATGASLCATGYHVVNSQHVRVASFAPPPTVDYRSLLRQNPFGCSTVIVRRSGLGAHRFPSMGHEDYALWLTLVGGGLSVSNVVDPLAEYTLVPGSVSRNKMRTLGFLYGVYRGHLGMNAAAAAWRTVVYAVGATRRHQPPL